VDVSTFRDAAGVDVAFRHWPVTDPRGVVLIAHGASEHSGRYERFASALVDAGLAAVAVDHRGHGATAAATGPGRLGPPGPDALVDDLDQLLDVMDGHHGGLPVALFGHSMGALIALAYAARHAERLRALVLCGFPASLAGAPMVAEQLRQATDAGARDEPAPLLAGYNAAFEPARTPFDWLSRDEAEVDRYVDDPLCGDDLPLTFGFLADLFAGVGPALDIDALAAITCPVLLIAGDRDPAAAMGDHVRELESGLRAAGVSVSSRIYPDARHELLNETNRDEVTADVIGWIERQL
jgi:alpha-beta hydrolase superfamily lysophospholipase